jgi:tetratricopeptide (TPR) repeat protein
LIFDPENNIVKLCAEGMASEGMGQIEKAKSLFDMAWAGAETNLEKFIAAHYLARHQQNTIGKLQWDKTALEMALKVNQDEIKLSYSSLYLNIARCFEDLDQFENAKINYEMAYIHLEFLAEDGYGTMIKSGVLAGRERMQNKLKR